jgi:hypothetical protein
MRPDGWPLPHWLLLCRPYVEWNLSRANGFPYDVSRTDIGLCLRVSRWYWGSHVETFARSFFYPEPLAPPNCTARLHGAEGHDIYARLDKVGTEGVPDK